MQYGIFLGYRFALGDRWNGEYLIAGLSDFANKPLFVTASRRDFADSHPHVTKRARTGKAGIVFPLKKRYEESNLTLEGIEAALKHWVPFATLEEHHDAPRDS
eukprot:4650117-Lingulodinium_polyedra.AAC.1